MTIVKIATSNGAQPIAAKLVKFKGFKEKFAVHKSYNFELDDEYVVTELSTGLSVCVGISERFAVANARAKLNKHKGDWDKVLQKSMAILKRYNIDYPVN